MFDKLSLDVLLDRATGRLRRNVLPQMPQDITVKLAVDSLATWGTNSLCTVPQMSKKTSCMLSVTLLTCLGDCGALPLRRLLFGLWVVAVDPNLLTGDDPRHEGWVISGLLTENPGRHRHSAVSGQEPKCEFRSGSDWM